MEGGSACVRVCGCVHMCVYVRVCIQYACVHVHMCMQACQKVTVYTLVVGLVRPAQFISYYHSMCDVRLSVSPCEHGHKETGGEVSLILLNSSTSETDGASRHLKGEKST